LPITLTATEHMMVAADFERWASTEPDPHKAAELNSLARLARALGKAAVEREEATKEAKGPARKRHRDPKGSPR
jgi:ferric-dicitrate binding protein FerR (iron transport regulator)